MNINRKYLSSGTHFYQKNFTLCARTRIKYGKIMAKEEDIDLESG